MLVVRYPGLLMPAADKPKHARRPDNRRGSADVVLTRRAGRRFNDLLVGQHGLAKTDGRTEKRRRRLLDELRQGALRSTGQALKPLEVLLRVQALLDLGEPVASIKKACKPPRAVEASDAVIDGVRRLQAAYGFSAAAYQFVGIDLPTLRRARVVLGPSAGADAAGAKGAGSARAARGPVSARRAARGEGGTRAA